MFRFYYPEGVLDLTLEDFQWLSRFSRTSKLMLERAESKK